MHNRISDALTRLFVWLRLLTPVRVEDRRGVGMLEYALMALVVIAIFAAVLRVAPDLVEGIFNDSFVVP